MYDDMANQAQDWLDDWKHQAQRRLEETQRMVTTMDKLSVTVTNGDGDVTVSMDSGGIVTDLKLDNNITSQPADRIAGAIMATMRQARNEVGKKAAKIVDDSIGLESETGKAIMAGFRKRLRKPTTPTGGSDD